MTMIPPRPEPSRWTRMINGDTDKIRGQDDGECHISQRPKGYYSSGPFKTGDAEIDAMTEPEIAVQLHTANIY